MKRTESVLREIRDRIAAALGEIEECASSPETKANYGRLQEAARELHACADEIQGVLMRIKAR